MEQVFLRDVVRIKGLMDTEAILPLRAAAVVAIYPAENFLQL